jgi:hypothetical protein
MGEDSWQDGPQGKSQRLCMARRQHPEGYAQNEEFPHFPRLRPIVS